MPVPKLSRRFYEVFGDEVATQLVTWFNEVDTTYKRELRELNDVNFARFDAKLEQRIAGLRGDLRSEFHKELGQLRGELGQLRGHLVKWMFVFWVGSTATTAMLVFAMLKVMV